MLMAEQIAATLPPDWQRPELLTRRVLNLQVQTLGARGWPHSGAGSSSGSHFLRVMT
jgi:hypothetical protein